MKFNDLYWDTKKRSELATISFLAQPGWESTCDPGAYNQATEQAEAQELVRKQHDPERGKRASQIKLEATEITKDFANILLFRNEAHVHTNRIFWNAIWVGRAVVMHYKNKYNRPRPSQIEPSLRPLIEVPGHPSYPSGHSTQMHLVALSLAEVVRHAVPTNVEGELLAIANRVAVNREWGGVHYESDSIAGLTLATAMLPIFKTACQSDFANAAKEWR